MSSDFECSNCRDSELFFRFARSAMVARNVVLEVIHRYKYNRAMWLEPLLAEWLIQQAAPELDPSQWDWIVPVPRYPTRRREREFNQAENLARRLSGRVGVPVHNRLLRRVLPTPTQTFLSREERWENVRKAFELRHLERLEGKRIVLVDDVFTTGATTNSCARVLRQAGAADVCVWTVARGI